MEASNLTGGSECGHSDPFCSHESGCKVDLEIANQNALYSDPLTQYIIGHFDFIGYRGSDSQYGTPQAQGGPEFTLEFNIENSRGAHWDIAFPRDSAAVLSVLLDGSGEGRVVSRPAPFGIDCGLGLTVCVQDFTRGITVQLEALASFGSIFDGWSGVSNDAAGSAQVNVKIDGPKTVTARFLKNEPPPDDSGCWAWNSARQAWLWICAGDPKPCWGADLFSLSCREPPPNGCWSWNSEVGGRGGWVLVDCRDRRRRSGESVMLGAVVGAVDPNDKAGSQGVGPNKYISGLEPLRYTINFENKPSANAPAQEVLIRDQLDSGKMDLESLALGPLTFGSRVLLPPPHVSAYTTELDLRPEKNLLLRIQVVFNKRTGQLVWEFTSLDPITREIPADPFRGFLPPNKNAPEGQGSVVFTVGSKPASPTETQIRNKATIIFDGTPLDTPEWLNTIDRTSPVSNVLPLPDTQAAPTFVVRWQGTDQGAGVKDYSIYVSDNGGEFVPWIEGAVNTQATFTGVVGHAYSFYSIARDLTRNMEAGKISAEATTRIMIVDLGADLAVTMADSPDPVVVDSTLTYLTTVTNAGTTAATQVAVTHQLPAGIQVGSIVPSQGHCPPGAPYPRTCIIGDLASGAKATVQIRAMPRSEGIIRASVSVLGSPTDPNPGNNSAFSDTHVVRPDVLGDINGDKVVDCKDIGIVRAAFGKRTGQPGWNAKADVVTDGVIDVRDLSYVSQRLPAGTRCN
jgi:uncharacterized repeat protein (TIGR01451 family)